MSNSIIEGETAHLTTLAPEEFGSSAKVYVERDGHTLFLASTVNLGDQLTFKNLQPPAVAGPAKLLLVVPTGTGLATFKITPNFSDPQKAVIVLPGAENAAQITLQCSTNLSTWVPATNGLYSGDVAKFFRIHLEKGKP